MELIFQEQRQEYFQRILKDTAAQEQTADVVIPDSVPDAQRVVDAFGTVLLRTASCGGEGGEIAGVVRAGVLFVDEKGTVRLVETQIPFSFRRELTTREASCDLRCACRLKSMDARLLNSRKILVRAGLVCSMELYAPRVRTVYDLPAPAPNLQLLRRELPMQLPLALGQRSFSIHEELEVPEDRAAICRALKTTCHAQVVEQRMVGNKAVFKGELALRLLYEDGEGKLETCAWTVPFSQYGEMERELDEGTLETTLTLTALEAEPDSQLESRRLLLSAELLAQCLVTGEQMVRYIEDAFCTDGTLTPTWEEWQMEAQLDRQTFRETAEASTETEAASVVDVQAYPEAPVLWREEGQTVVELPVNCNILYYDAEGELQGRSLRPVVRLTTEGAGQTTCEVAQILTGEALCTADRRSLSLRLPVETVVRTTVEQPLRAICAAQVTPEEGTVEGRPGVILRRVEGEESIWEIAKGLKTPVAGILKANHLTGDTVSEATILLIPM